MGHVATMEGYKRAVQAMEGKSKEADCERTDRKLYMQTSDILCMDVLWSQDKGQDYKQGDMGKDWTGKYGKHHKKKKKKTGWDTWRRWRDINGLYKLWRGKVKRQTAKELTGNYTCRHPTSDAWMCCGVKTRDKIINKVIWERIGQENMGSIIRRRSIRWMGHVATEFEGEK